MKMTKLTRWQASLAAVALLLAIRAPVHASENESHGGHSHIGIFAGVGEEQAKGHSHSAKGFGLVYEYKFPTHMDIGIVVERLEVDGHANTLAVIPFGYTFDSGFRLFAGPGYEFKGNPTKDKWLLRAGVAYEFELSERWTLSPEVFVDALENGTKVYVGGVVLGYGF